MFVLCCLQTIDLRVVRFGDAFVALSASFGRRRYVTATLQLCHAFVNKSVLTTRHAARCARAPARWVAVGRTRRVACVGARERSRKLKVNK